MPLECKPIQRIYAHAEFIEPPVELAVLPSSLLCAEHRHTVFGGLCYSLWNQIDFGVWNSEPVLSRLPSVAWSLAIQLSVFMTLVLRLPSLCDSWLLWHLIFFFDSYCGAKLRSLTALCHAFCLEAWLNYLFRSCRSLSGVLLMLGTLGIRGVGHHLGEVLVTYRIKVSYGLEEQFSFHTVRICRTLSRMPLVLGSFDTWSRPLEVYRWVILYVWNMVLMSLY